MKVNLAKLYSAIESLNREIVSYKGENRIQHTIDVELVEADLNKGVPMTVLTLSCNFEKEGKKRFASVEIYDDIDSATPTMNLRFPVNLD